MVEKIDNGRIYDSRLSNETIESIKRKIKDLKRLGRDFRNFEHFRNRFLYATRSVPVLNGITDYNPVLYLEEDDWSYVPTNMILTNYLRGPGIIPDPHD